MSENRNNKNSKNKTGTQKGSSQKKKGGAPDYRVVTPKGQADSDAVFWTRIGSAWNAKDGAISISLNALPLGDRIMLFVNDEEEEGNE